MGYNDSNRTPKIDEIAYVRESQKATADWIKGKIVGISHDDQEVLVKTDLPNSKILKGSTRTVMFGEDPQRPPEPGVD